MDELPPTSASGASDGSPLSGSGLAEPPGWARPSTMNWRHNAGGLGQPGRPLVPAKTASPRLTDELFSRLVAYGTPQETRPGDVLFSPGDVDATDPATLAGNMAWAGQALVQLYAATGRTAYLAGAEAIGNWVQTHCHDTRGPGGYTGGETANGQKIEWKSTEHNIDLYALFSLLARKTGDPAWSARAAWAKRFVVAMWNAKAGHFAVGTATDGVTTNPAQVPEDVNSWSFLALRDPAYAASVTWISRNLAVTAGGFSGVSPCLADRSGVWFEGTAHLADALEFRGDPGDDALAAKYLADIYYAQAHGPNGDGLGIIAASKDGLTDCAGGSYYASLHTGTTAWYILAAMKVDPFHPIR